MLGGEFRNYVFSARKMGVRGQEFMVATGVDITERREAEAEQRRLQDAVERSAAEWKETFDTVTTPILITERSGAIVRVNRAALELCRLTEQQLDGKQIGELSTGEPWQTAAQLITYIAGEPFGTTAETKDRGGEERGTSSSPLLRSERRSERFILVLWEITGIVELQESLRRRRPSAMGTSSPASLTKCAIPSSASPPRSMPMDEEMSRPGYVGVAATLRQESEPADSPDAGELLEYGKPQRSPSSAATFAR